MLKNILKLTILCGLPLFHFLAMADVQVLNFPNADIFISRRADIWSPDKNESDYTAKPIKTREFGYLVWLDPKKFILGSPGGFFGTLPDNPIANGVALEFKNNNIKFSSQIQEHIGEPIYIDPENLPRFFDAENVLFQEMVISAGDPSKLTDKVSNQRFVGNLMSLATALVLTKNYGLNNGGNFAVGSGVMGDVASLPRTTMAAVLPLKTLIQAETDFSLNYQAYLAKI
jgi:hypothetical protein